MIFKILRSKKVIVSVILCIVIVFIGVTGFFAGTSITVSDHFFDRESFSEKISSSQIPMTHESTPENIEWFLSEAEKTEITSEGKSISAAFLKNKESSHSYVIILGALMSCEEDFSDQALHFYDIGFNVYVPTYLTENLTMGKNEQYYLKSVVDYIIETDSQASIFIYGMGMGGTTAVLYAGGEVPANVKGIIADSAYGDVEELFEHNIERFYSVSSFPTVKISSAYMGVKNGWEYSDVDVLSAANKTKVPVLYIHGTEDSIVPVNQSNNLFEVTLSKGTKHITIHGADHCQTLKTDPVKYWREADSFIMDSFV